VRYSFEHDESSLCPAVAQFAHRMQSELDQHQRKVAHFEDESVDELLGQLLTQLQHLHTARCRLETPHSVMHEAADLANAAMMVALQYKICSEKAG